MHTPTSLVILLPIWNARRQMSCEEFHFLHLFTYLSDERNRRCLPSKNSARGWSFLQPCVLYCVFAPGACSKSLLTTWNHDLCVRLLTYCSVWSSYCIWNWGFDINILINFTFQPTFWNNLYDQKTNDLKAKYINLKVFGVQGNQRTETKIINIG